MMIIGSSLSIAAFTSLKLFPILMEKFELYGCLIIYGSCCIVGAVFVLLFLQETNGLSIDEVAPFRKVNNKLLTHDEGQRPLMSVKQHIFSYHTFRDRIV